MRPRQGGIGLDITYMFFVTRMICVGQDSNLNLYYIRSILHFISIYYSHGEDCEAKEEEDLFITYNMCSLTQEGYVWVKVQS